MWRWVGSVLIACAELGSAPLLVAQGADVALAMQHGVVAMRAGQLNKAEEEFREAVRLGPEQADAVMDLGLVLAREGKMDEAVAAMRKTLQLNPDMPSAHEFLGVFLLSTHQPEEGRRQLLAELAVDPNSLETLTYLGDSDLAAGKNVEAAAWLDRASAISPDDLNVLELRGRAHSQVAHDLYAKMVQLDPGSWHVHRVQAQLYADEDRHKEAIAEYEAAIKLEARNPDLYERLGDEYRTTSQLELALAAYSKERELTPDNEGALYNVGSVDIELGNNAAGVPLLFRVVKLFPGSARAEYYLGRGLANLSRDEEAADWLQKAASDDANGEIAKRSFFELARADRRLHRMSAAATATAGYNRIRLAQEKANQQQVDRFKTQGSPAPGADPKAPE